MPIWNSEPFQYNHKDQFIEIKTFEVDEGNDRMVCGQTVVEFPSEIVNGGSVVKEVDMLMNNANCGKIKVAFQYQPSDKGPPERGMLYVQPFMAELSRDNIILGKTDPFVRLFFENQEKVDIFKDDNNI